LEADGSPPRAWGQWAEARLECRALRFTPTGVGTIMRTTPRTSSRSVHPHGRGDNCRARIAAATVFGSPPRAWGQLCRCRAAVEENRFTPTGVGTIGNPDRAAA